VTAAAWETVVTDAHASVRRLAVPGGWIYQTQIERTYDSAYGTVGREYDRGRPVWGPLVFVPLSITAKEGSDAAEYVYVGRGDVTIDRLMMEISQLQFQVKRAEKAVALATALRDLLASDT